MTGLRSHSRPEKDASTEGGRPAAPPLLCRQAPRRFCRARADGETGRSGPNGPHRLCLVLLKASVLSLGAPTHHVRGARQTPSSPRPGKRPAREGPLSRTRVAVRPAPPATHASGRHEGGPRNTPAGWMNEDRTPNKSGLGRRPEAHSLNLHLLQCFSLTTSAQY